jgi:phosphate transport system substrate-binding protein
MHHTRRPRTILGHLLMALSLVVLAAPAAAEQQPQTKTLKLIGAGASFAAPLYLRWFRDYYLAHPQVEVDYQTIGSAGGVKDLIAGRIDFAGTDLRFTDEEAAQIPGGVTQVPMAAGGIAVIYNIDGVSDLKLSRSALAGIFSGTVARWNDPAIAATNPGTALPDLPITVVGRADTGGTSYKFVRYLSAIDPAFAEDVGTTMSPSWPKALKERGGLVRGRGNDGVAASVRAIPGSIGYVQYAFGFLPGLKMAALENRAGKLVAPGTEAFEAALRSIYEDQRIENAVDPDGDGAYPMVAITWLAFRNEYEEPAKLTTLKDIVAEAMGPGQAVTAQLGYVPFPAPVIDYVESQLK